MKEIGFVVIRKPSNEKEPFDQSPTTMGTDKKEEMKDSDLTTATQKITK